MEHYPARIRIRVLKSPVFFAGRCGPFRRPHRAMRVPNAHERAAVLQTRDLWTSCRSHRSTKRVRAIYNGHAMPQCVEARHNMKVALPAHGVRERAFRNHRRVALHGAGARRAFRRFIRPDTINRESRT
jgi:hypothetical protein